MFCLHRLSHPAASWRAPFITFHRSCLSTNTSNITTIRLYRILMRLVNRLNDDFPLQQPLNPRDYGHARLFSMPSSFDKRQDIYKLFVNWHDDNPIIYTWFNAVADVPFEKDEDSDCTSLWASQVELKHAIRQAFAKTPTNNDDLVIPMQRLAMNAIQNVQQQYSAQQQSSVSIDTERGVRVVATSSCIGISSTGIQEVVKYRFAYRMRVENLINSAHAVQLLGRTWRIQDTDANGEAVGQVQHVHAPTTGVVGHLPVLLPGNVFEYMSGCELFTQHGTMSGSFHMAVVPSNTRSAMVGDAVPAFQDKNPNVFEMPVHEFPLDATEGTY